MALTPAERKMWLGHGGLTRIARRTRRTMGHVSQVNSEKRGDAKVERAIMREIVKVRPDISPADVWPVKATA